MTKSTLFLIPLVALALVCSCIVSDQLTTLTIGEDGSASWISFRSNIRSTEPGAKGAEELRQFVEAFDRREDADCRRVVEAGGTIVDARWLRQEEPHANVIVARLPDAAALQNFYTYEDEKGVVTARARFSRKSGQRRFSITIPGPRDRNHLDPLKKETVPELRQAQANGISETRVVVAGGRIVNARGFTVAEDRRSALIEPAEIHDLVSRAKEDVELFVEWELAEETAVRSSRL